MSVCYGTALRRLKTWLLLLVFGAISSMTKLTWLQSSGRRNMSPKQQQAHWHVFVQQRRSMAQRNKIYQALDTHTMLVSRINSLFCWFYTWGSLTIQKIWTIVSHILYEPLYSEGTNQQPSSPQLWQPPYLLSPFSAQTNRDKICVFWVNRISQLPAFSMTTNLIKRKDKDVTQSATQQRFELSTPE